MPHNHPAPTKRFSRQYESLLTPHPGIYYGKYPAKKQKNTSWLETAELRLNKLFRDIAKQPRKQHQVMLKRVHANHKFVEAMSDAELDKWIIDIKCQLHSKGLKDELICRAFAIIKEVFKKQLLEKKI